MDKYEYSRDEFKNYLRINFDEDNQTIDAFWHGAEEYICTQVSTKATPERLAKYDMFPVAVKLLATLWYETKIPVPQSGTVKANTSEIPFGVTALIYPIQSRFFNDPKFDEYQDSGVEDSSKPR